MKPTGRMMGVLIRLSREPTLIWPVDRLRRDIPGYESDPRGDRNWQYDSEALRARGLIKTGISSRHTPRATGVRLGLRGAKPYELHLSEKEHEALVAARRARGVEAALPSPLAGNTTRGNALQTIGDVLRRLEEFGDWTTVGALAREMGQRPARLLDTLQAAWAFDLEGWWDADKMLFMELFDEADQQVRPADVRVCVIRGDDPDRPMRGRGLALLGAGAYTLEEVDERLGLIADVRDGAIPGDLDVLEGAERKLLQWRQRLMESRG